MKYIINLMCCFLFALNGTSQSTTTINNLVSLRSYVIEVNESKQLFLNKLDTQGINAPYKYLNAFSSNNDLIVEYHLENLKNKKVYYFGSADILSARGETLKQMNFSLTSNSKLGNNYSNKGKLILKNVINTDFYQKKPYTINMKLNALEKVTFNNRLPRFAFYGGLLVLGQIFRQQAIKQDNRYVNHWQEGASRALASPIFNKAKNNNIKHIIFSNSGLLGTLVDSLFYYFKRRKNIKEIIDIEKSFKID